MRNRLVFPDGFFQGHMYAGGCYANTTGTLTYSAPTKTITIENTGFLNIQIYHGGSGTGNAYVEFYVDNRYAGYIYTQTATKGNWQTMAFPVLAGQVLKMTVTGLPSGGTFYYRLQNYYYSGS